MLRKLMIAVTATLLVLSVGILVASSLWRMPGEQLTPAGMQRNSSYYIEMPDGARIAADLWLPADLAPGQRLPTVIEATRYWRAMGLTRLGRIAAMLGVELPGVQATGYNAFFPANGYAMLTLDVRGTGASSGVHDTEYAPAETADYRQVIDWVTTQDWSSGEVFAIGVSYSGTTAELMTTVHHPALKGVAPLFSDFDVQMQLATPGGVYQPAFIEAWSKLVSAMDRNDVCGVIKASEMDDSADCSGPELLISGVKPVAGNARYLTQAIGEHNSPNVAEMVKSMHFRDSTWGTTELLPADNQPFGLKQEIERNRTPMFLVTGWFDAATTNGALARFATFSNPQQLWIAPFSHGGSHDTDPYKPLDAPPLWSQQELLERVLAFFESLRRDRPDDTRPAAGEPELHYYVNGADTFKRTLAWPPAHLAEQIFYLAPDSSLATQLPDDRQFDRYQVDASTSRRGASRWLTQLTGGDVYYQTDTEASAKVLNYTTPAFAQATELTGSVVLDLWMTSDQPEGALYAYLSDVAPDGTVRYLTEGVLNLQHRATTEQPAYPMFGPTHSFLQADAKPPPTRRLFSFSTTLFATSALIKPGHRLRLSLAGADAASFAAVPAQPPMPRWNVYFGPTSPSALTLPLAPWTP